MIFYHLDACRVVFVRFYDLIVMRDCFWSAKVVQDHIDALSYWGIVPCPSPTELQTVRTVVIDLIASLAPRYNGRIYDPWVCTQGSPKASLRQKHLDPKYARFIGSMIQHGAKQQHVNPAFVAAAHVLGGRLAVGTVKTADDTLPSARLIRNVEVALGVIAMGKKAATLIHRGDLSLMMSLMLDGGGKSLSLAFGTTSC